jgi:hypothetical protein
LTFREKIPETGFGIEWVLYMKLPNAFDVSRAVHEVMDTVGSDSESKNSEMAKHVLFLVKKKKSLNTFFGR